jgi:8-hydroxy-5-deazaflavin:NADPH oxidoreductase
MKIGIVGAGNIGSAPARHWTALGHDVMIANSRGPDTIRDVALARTRSELAREYGFTDVDGTQPDAWARL